MDKKAVAKFLSVLSVVVLVSSLLFVLFVPKPSTKGLAAKDRTARSKILTATKFAKDNIDAADKVLVHTVWQETPELVGPKALAKVSKYAQDHRIKLSAFRPQKQIDGVLIQLPFVITVEGSFSDVMEFEKELEKPENKLAVNMVQLASADAASDKVSGNLYVLAYLVNNELKTESASSNSASKGDSKDVKAG